MMQLKSAWTPLANKDANKKLFEERKCLLLSWFSKWSESQRKQAVISLFELCTNKQLEALAHFIENRIPVYQIDFTRTLPRFLCIYIFSFLDPRSLCRCAQVCWYWRYLAEANELWASKCIRRGWDLIASQSQWEPGIWKKHYIQNIRCLQLYSISKSSARSSNVIEQYSGNLFTKHSEFSSNHFSHAENSDNNEPAEYCHSYKSADTDRSRTNDCKKHKDDGNLSERGKNDKVSLEPWRAPSRRPSEIHRLNYFDNEISVSKSSRSEVQRRRYSSAGTRRYSAISSSSNMHNIYNPTQVKSDLHERDDNISVNSKQRQSVSMIKSIYSNDLLIIPRKYSQPIPWKPTSCYASKPLQINFDENIKKMKEQEKKKKKKDQRNSVHRHQQHHQYLQSLNVQNNDLEENKNDLNKLHAHNSKVDGSIKSPVLEEKITQQEELYNENHNIDNLNTSTRSSIHQSKIIACYETPKTLDHSNAVNIINNANKNSQYLQNPPSYRSLSASLPSSPLTSPSVEEVDSSVHQSIDGQQHQRLSSPKAASTMTVASMKSAESKARTLDSPDNLCNSNNDSVPQTVEKKNDHQGNNDNNEDPYKESPEK
uniref:F-box domain-containing protein n=1 Tax=Trichobilharzia regenti TaxID=157069 RepID=A0AA85J0Q8_TRIRE|nr:unnamed protein product [Trichobilharzia regenti]